MPGADGFLPMGIVGRPHGIKGEIGVDWRGDYVPAANTPLVMRLPAFGDRQYTVRQTRWHKGRLLLTLAGIGDRDAAEALKGATVLVSRDLLAPLNEDEAYLQDLPGCSVYLPDGELLGLLDHFEFPAGQEIWSIVDSQNRETLFPARDSFIQSIDLAARKIVIAPPPGLVEVYRA